MAKTRKDSKGRVFRKGEGYRTQDNRYIYRYTDPRGVRRTIYARTLEELREKEDELKRDQLDGIDSYVRNVMTVNEAFDRYLFLKTSLRRTTRANYEMMYNKHVRDGFGKRCVGDIKFSDVVLFYKMLVEEDGIAPVTVGTIHCCLKPTFEMCVRDEIIRKNPTDGVLREISNDIGKNKGVRHALTLNDQVAFMDYIEGHPVYDHWHPIFTILLGTGLRCGEFVGLRWKDIDLDERTIDVNHALVRVKPTKGEKAKRLGVSLPKTDAGIRVVPMMDDVCEAFHKIYEEQLITGFNETIIEGMSGFIFKNANGDVLCEQNINAAIRRIVESYNMDEMGNAMKQRREPHLLPHFSCHQLRHTFCTRFCENESNLKVIQDVMGHKNIKTTMNVYAEATNDKKREAMQKLSAAWKEFKVES